MSASPEQRSLSRWIGPALVGLVALLIVLFVLPWFRPSSDQPPPASAQPAGAGQQDDSQSAPPSQPEQPVVPGGAEAPGGGIPEPVVDGGDQTADTADSSPVSMTTEFAPSDLTARPGRVDIDLGRYRVAQGDTVPLSVSLSGPALESFMLVMEYDPALLAYADDSARARGQAFLHGIEFYADNAQGRMVVIHKGLPGFKNVNATRDEEVVTFRMQAKRAGQAMLRFPARGTEFTDGRGRVLTDYHITGGTIDIR